MKMRLAWLFAVGIAQTAALPAQSPADQKALAAQFEKIVVDRKVAVARRDTAGYRRMVAHGARYVEDDGSMTTADEHIAGFGKEKRLPVAEVTELHVRRVGPVAIVDYLETHHDSLGSHELRMPARIIDNFAFQNGRWLLIESGATPQPPMQWQKVAAVDSETLQEYVGRYELWPGFVLTITRKGMQLYVQATGETEATPYYPSTADAFYVVGDPTLFVFTRDRHGSVTGIATNVDGQTTARRLP